MIKKAYPGVCTDNHVLIMNLFDFGYNYTDMAKEIVDRAGVRISPSAISKYVKKFSAPETLLGVVGPPVSEDIGELIEDTGVPEEEEQGILEAQGYDPAEFYIAGTKKWQRQPGGPFLHSYDIRAIPKVEPITVEAFESLIEQIEDVSYLKNIKDLEASRGTGEATFVFAAGDLQLGKSDGDGTQGIVKRYMESVQNAVEKIMLLHDQIGPIHISWVGDCIEGMVSQGGKNARRTELTTTQQVQLLQTLMIYTIKAFAPLTSELSADSVPGNHDQAQREPVNTDASDSWAVQALASIKQSLQEFGDPYLYGHVSFGIVPFDEDTLVRVTSGTRLVQVHGDQWQKGKHWEWLKGQIFNRNSPMQGVHVMIHGHNHTGLLEQYNDMFCVRTPSFELESNYYRRRAGAVGNPSAATFLTKDGDVFFFDFK